MYTRLECAYLRGEGIFYWNKSAVGIIIIIIVITLYAITVVCDYCACNLQLLFVL